MQQSVADTYKSGQRVVGEIIVRNSLQTTLEGHAYAGFFSGDSWLILKKGEISFEIITGSINSTIHKTCSIDLADKALSSLFAWVNHRESILYDVENAQYTPLYYYYVLFDENHKIKMEFNAYTMNEYKKARHHEKLIGVLPFTKEQFELIWSLFLYGKLVLVR